MRREEAAIVMLLQARQQSLQSRLYVADDAECNGMTMTDMRGVEIDLNDGGLVGIELGPRKICTEKKQRVAVEDRMIAGGSADHAAHADIVGVVVRHEVLTPRGVGHRRFQPRSGSDYLVVRAGAAGAGVDRDCVAPVENGRDLVEVGLARANDRPARMDGVGPFLVRCGIGNIHRHYQHRHAALG